MSDAVAGRRAPGRVDTVIKGKWHVDARLGSGGMATVYAATHRNGHRAALKMLHTQLSRDAAVRARFLREAYVANAVGHPAVVRIEDDDTTEDGAVFLVMELLEGETLEARRIRLGGALPVGEVMEIGEQALDALAAAHEKGIVHRDVKPENVFVTTGGRVKLLDFGLARMKDVQGEATRTGVTIGTPEFMPPEQAMGRRDAVDARSDVWGLGATLFTAMTGQYVHDASNLHEQLMASATMRARSLRTVAPQVPVAVGQVVDRALELDMADRWPSAREMQRALRAARSAPPDSSLESLTIAISPSTDPLAFPISSDKTIVVPEKPTSSDKPTMERPVPIEVQKPPYGDRTISMNAPVVPPMAPAPNTERLGQTGGGPVVQHLGQTGGGPPVQHLAQTGGGPPVQHLAQTGGGRVVQHASASGSGSHAIEQRLAQSGANAIFPGSGAMPTGLPSGTPNRNMLAQSGGYPTVAPPPSPARARGALLAVVLILLGLVALVLAILVRAGILLGR